jgi:TonB family protein
MVGLRGLNVHFTPWQHLLAADRFGRRNSATTMRIATCCWLLVTLAATTVLAQTHPKKRPMHKPAVVQKQWPTRMREEEKAFIQNTYEELDQHTQPATLDPNPVYFYVERMPTLNGQHAFSASIAAITHSLVVPADAPEGRVFVQFVVTKEGVVSQPQVVKGLRADVDSAVVTATRKLPRFTPGNQKGRAVAVSITLPVAFPVKKEQP